MLTPRPDPPPPPTLHLPPRRRELAAAAEEQEAASTLRAGATPQGDAGPRSEPDAGRAVRQVAPSRSRRAVAAGDEEAIALQRRIARLCEDRTGDIDGAIAAYRAILELAPGHGEALDGLARLYEGSGRWAELVEVSHRQAEVVANPAKEALLWFRCGSVMETKFGRDDDAIRYYEAAIQQSPAYLPALHGLRDLHLRREDWPKVILTLELEAQLRGDGKERAGIHAHIGAIRAERLGDAEGAVACYERALAIDPECVPACGALFEVHFGRGDHERALPLVAVLAQKGMFEGDPAQRSELCRKRAVALHATGDPAAAAESLVTALEVWPENLAALELLVGLCRGEPDVGDQAGAFSQLDRLYRQHGGSARPRPAGGAAGGPDGSTGTARCPQAAGATGEPVPGSAAARLLSRVAIGRSLAQERALDLEAAEALLAEALRLAPDDLFVIEAEASLALALGQHERAAGGLERFLGRSRDRAARGQAMLRLADVLSEHAMASARAVEVLERLLVEDPESVEGHFALAQELQVLGRFVEARRAGERLLGLVAAPGRDARPAKLARCYDLAGRIAAAEGDHVNASRCFRRALDLDPGFPSPALALARRLAGQGGLAKATALLEGAIAGLPRGLRGAGEELARGLARVHERSGNRREARRLLGELVAGAPSLLDERVELAGLALLDGDLRAAGEQLREVLRVRIDHVPALQLLLRLFDEAGVPHRAVRVAAVLRLLGFADVAARAPVHRPRPPSEPIGDERLRTLLLAPPWSAPPAPAPAPLDRTWDRAFACVADRLEARFPPPPPPARDHLRGGDDALQSTAAEVKRLLGIEAEVGVARELAGAMQAIGGPSPALLLDPGCAALPDGERRFLLGRGLQSLRDGGALVSRLRPRERAELGSLLAQLLVPAAERPASGACGRDADAEQFVRSLPARSRRATEPLAGLAPAQPFETWLAGLESAANRSGLLACDDLAAAARALARLGGEELAVSEQGGVLLAQVPALAGLVAFFLSDSYEALRQSPPRP